MKNITINRRDVYRAKHDEVTDKETIFYESYRKATKVLHEIIDNSEEFCSEQFQFEKNWMTNNVILFNGRRGQGKTTAMRSFSDFLENPKEDVEDAFKFQKKFYCLETIDPSCMNSRESIVRIVLTYLFSFAMSYIEKIPVNDTYANVLKGDVLDRFQRCYDFVDYLYDMRMNLDYMPDDIEYISKMGNSQALKRELWNLIKKILEIIGRDHEKRESVSDRNMFLILKIDDADLSTTSTFKLCDEIRNYFSLPNVIVIMAADLVNIRINIEEEYLSRLPKKSLKYDFEKNKRNCRENAMKYVEKLFPQGHVIRLPQIDELLLNHSTEIALIYETQEKEGDIHGSGKGKLDIQDQILGKLYENTGILLVKPTNKPHAFLPRTMRELAHFAKMIFEMQKIDFRKIMEYYGADRNSDIPEKEKSSAWKQEIEKAKENLHALNQYFVDYWCPLYLKSAQAEGISNMYSMENTEIKAQFINKDKNKDKGNLHVERMLVEYICDPKNSEQKRMAYMLFYSIRNLFRLYDALENDDIMKDFIDFSCKEFDFMKMYHYGMQSDSDWNIYRYDISMEKLSDWAESAVSMQYSTMVFYNMFCDTDRTGEDIFIYDTKWDQIGNKKDVKEVHFDLMQSMKKLLFYYHSLKGADESKGTSMKNVLDYADSAIEDLSKEAFVGLGKDHNIIETDDLMTICTYVCNVEYQRYVDEILTSHIRENTREDILQRYEDVLRDFDSIYNSFLFLNDQSKVGENISRYLNDEEHKKILFSMLESNDANRAKILREQKKIITEMVNKIIGYIAKEDAMMGNRGEFMEEIGSYDLDMQFISFAKGLDGIWGTDKFISGGIVSEDFVNDGDLKKVAGFGAEVMEIVNGICEDCFLYGKNKSGTMRHASYITQGKVDEIKEKFSKYIEKLERVNEGIKKIKEVDEMKQTEE